MKNEQKKGGTLPLVAGGVLMVACCALPVILGTAALASISAWFSGWSIGETAALAGIVALGVYGVIRLRAARSHAGDDAPIPNGGRGAGKE